VKWHSVSERTSYVRDDPRCYSFPRMPRTALQTRKQDFVRHEIFEAALTRFLAQGYDANTAEDIAEAAGVSRRTFFRYYASKDDVMVKAVDSYGDFLVASVRTAPPDRRPLDLVRHVAVSVANTVVALPRTREAMTITLGSPSARRAQLLELEIVTRQLSAAFEKRLGRRAGGRAPYLIASMTMAVLAQTLGTWYEQPDAKIAGIVDDTIAALTSVLAGPPSTRLRRVGKGSR